MVAYTNFYETTAEAELRLRGTLVLYDNEPYYVLGVSDHKGDGIFRIYLDKMQPSGVLWSHENLLPDYSGSILDSYIEKTPSCQDRLLRKMMNSPKFNKFRPFPLGMVNSGDSVFYCERGPVRHTQQGLLESMIAQHPISLTKSKSFIKRGLVSLYSPGMYSCIMNDYPSFDECITNLLDEDVTNEGVAFNRQFALLKGPFNYLFLAYKRDVIGTLPFGDCSELILGDKFRYTAEVVSELNIFDTIKVKEK